MVQMPFAKLKQVQKVNSCSLRKKNNFEEAGATDSMSQSC